MVKVLTNIANEHRLSKFKAPHCYAWRTTPRPRGSKRVLGGLLAGPNGTGAASPCSASNSRSSRRRGVSTPLATDLVREGAARGGATRSRAPMTSPSTKATAPSEMLTESAKVRLTCQAAPAGAPKDSWLETSRSKAGQSPWTTAAGQLQKHSAAGRPETRPTRSRTSEQTSAQRQANDVRMRRHADASMPRNQEALKRPWEFSKGR